MRLRKTKWRSNGGVVTVDSGTCPSARDIQQKRFSNNGSSDIICNADMHVRKIQQFYKLQDEGAALSLSKCQSLMRVAMTQLNLSARAYHRTQSVKLARTLADLAGSEEVQSAHLVESLHALQSPKIDICVSLPE